MNYYKLDYICNEKKIKRKAQIYMDDNQRIIEFVEKPNLVYKLVIKENQITVTKQGSLNITFVHKINEQQIIDYEAVFANNTFKGSSNITTTDISITGDKIMINFISNEQKYQEIFIIKGVA